ncbi:MAG: SDR family oxidoreductase [Deltaproteobacteria bacterium]|nr:SDR family oxidoreductase [Deltaproteobacteria bacterium]
MNASVPQVILITGCSSGIGFALASELASRRQLVVATARCLDNLAEMAKHPDVITLPLDVTDKQSIDKAIDEVIDKFGHIDMLINNAGFSVVGPLAELSINDVSNIYDTNVIGTLAMIQAVAPHMIQERSGRIVNIGSIVGILGTPFAGAYCMSKASVHMLSEVLRLELKPFGVDVISVEPGRVQSKIADNAKVDLSRYENDNSLYKPFLESIRRRVNMSQESPMSTSEFADKVATYILKPRPPRVVRVGRGAKVLPLLRRLIPGVIRDYILRHVFNLKLKKSS